MKKRTGKMISLSLAVAMAMTAAPVTALADDNVQGSVIEANELTPVQSTGETGTDTTTVDTNEEEGTAWAELTPAEKVGEEEALNALPAEEIKENEVTTIVVTEGDSLADAFAEANAVEGNETVTIEIAEGTFAPTANEQLKITRDNVVISGAGKDVTTIDCGEFSCSGQGGIIISANNVVIQNLTVTSAADSGNVAAIKVTDVQASSEDEMKLLEDVEIKDVTVSSEKGHGLNLHGVENATVDGLTVTKAGKSGISLANAVGVTVENTDIQNHGLVWAAIQMMYKADSPAYKNAVDLIYGTNNQVDFIRSERSDADSNGNRDAIHFEAPFEGTFMYSNAITLTASDSSNLPNISYKAENEDTKTFYQSFENALADAKDNETIFMNGEFNQPLLIKDTDKKVKLVGDENTSIFAMTIMNADNITLEGLNFTNASTENNLDTNPSALYVQNASGITVNSCTFDGTAIEGTAVAIATAPGTEDFTVENSTIKNFVMSGYHNTGDNITYDNNSFENIQSGVAFDGTNGITVTENTFDNANGIRLRPYGETKCENVTVTENSFNSVNESSPYGQYAVVTTTLDSEGKPVAGGNGVDSVDLSGNYWGGADTVEAIENMVISNEGQSVSIDTFYKTPEDLENGNETVVTTETGIKVNGVWYKAPEDLKNLIKNGIPADATVEVYGKVNIPFSTGISKENGSIVEGYFVVDTDNVTIKGMTEDATLYTSEIHPNGTWGSQSFMLITGDNVTLEGLTIMPQATTDDGETNKTIEFVGNTLNMHNCTVKPNETPATNDGGSLYFNGDKDTVLVEDCIFDEVTICFDSVDSAESILIQNNTFKNPGNPYTIGNTSWSTPPATSMADITVKENVFQGLSDDTVLVRQKMEGNFVLEENTTDNGSSIADMVEFVTSDSLSKDKMHVTVTENGQTVVLTPNEEGSPEVDKTFKLNATSLSTKVGRSVTLTAYLDDDKIAADWAVDDEEKATNQETFEFTPNSKGTYIITASYEADGITYVATCEVTAKSSSGGGSSHSYDGYITIINPKNGDVSVSDTWADEDQKITLTITPDKGYEVDKIEIVDDEGDKIDAKKVEDEDDKYTFRMANCDVTVTVTFKEEGTTTEDTDKEEDKDEETTELNFTDVKESDWFYKGVAYVVDKGIMSGVSENQFDPSGKLTRAMLVQMLYNMESRPACDAENAFIDVPVGQWYTDAVIWANDAKIVSGMGDGLFAPNMEITREQMVAMLYNYAKYKGYDVTASADLSKFADSASVSTWAQPAMQWAVAEGYISGMGDNQLAPQGTATRAEIASVIMRFMEATAESAETAE